jgi:hypothetical protein
MGEENKQLQYGSGKLTTTVWERKTNNYSMGETNNYSMGEEN